MKRLRSDDVGQKKGSNPDGAQNGLKHPSTHLQAFLEKLSNSFI